MFEADFLEEEKAQIRSPDIFGIPPDGVVVVFGKNWMMGLRGLELSMDSKIIALAAAILSGSGCGECYFYTSGYTNSKRNMSEAAAMRSYGFSLTPCLLTVNIVFEEDSFDTYSNVFNVVQMLIKRKLLDRPLIIITSKYHLKRVRDICYIHGLMDVIPIAAEDIVKYCIGHTALYKLALKPYRIF